MNNENLYCWRNGMKIDIHTQRIIITACLSAIITFSIIYCFQMDRKTKEHSSVVAQPAQQSSAQPEAPAQPAVPEFISWDGEASKILSDDGTGHKRQIIYGIKQSASGNVVIWKLGNIVE